MKKTVIKILKFICTCKLIWLLVLAIDFFVYEKAIKEDIHFEHKTAKEVIRKMGLTSFLKTRYVPFSSFCLTLKEEGSKKEMENFNINWLIFKTRYRMGTAIMGYDFL